MKHVETFLVWVFPVSKYDDATFLFCLVLRPNCFQIVVQHFSEEHYIFYFAGETPEQAQVRAFVGKYNLRSTFLSCGV